PHVYLSDVERHIMLVLKRIARTYVVDSHHVGVAQQSQSAAMIGLLTSLERWIAEEPSTNELPEPLRSYILAEEFSTQKATGKVRQQGVITRRCLADYVCSLTDFKALL